MNNGKICISVCAKTADELFEKIARAEPLADLIEVRFDCLESSEVPQSLERIAGNHEILTPLLATFRSTDQGGQGDVKKDERVGFWTSGINKDFWGGDFEDDVIDIAIESNWRNRICSQHEMPGTPLDVNAVYDKLKSTGASIVKIAVSADDVLDGLPVWNLLAKVAEDKKPLIPIAMGEAGKWTRILGPAHGAYLTYASLETGSETAAGQISAEDMRDVYRVKELGPDTEVFGIVAGDTSYTASPWMHNPAFKAAEMDRVFVPLQVSDLDEFMTRMVDPDTREVEMNFKGFSVTNPHKQKIIQYLDHIDETAKKIGAVNTVKIENGKLLGYNTDAPGFIAPLIKSFGKLKGVKVGIAGAGGAARACVYALKQEGAIVSVFARRPRRAAALAEEFGVKAGSADNSFKPGAIDILVNATPLGTKGPEQESTIAIAGQMQGLKLIYDLVYNPLQTRLLSEARIAGVPALGGMDMVLAQGRKQFEIWTGELPSVEAMRSGLLRRLR